MNLLNPFSWFRKPEPVDAKPLPPDEDPERFARRAIDSTEVPFEVTVTMRCREDLRIISDRYGRRDGFRSLSELMRHLLVEYVKSCIEHERRIGREIDELALQIDGDEDDSRENGTRRVTRKRGR